jgi:hypothetical protein
VRFGLPGWRTAKHEKQDGAAGQELARLLRLLTAELCELIAKRTTSALTAAVDGGSHIGKW